MPAQPDDHWGKLASDFGVKITPPETAAETDQDAVGKADQLPPPAEPKKATPVQSRPPEKPKVTEKPRVTEKPKVTETPKVAEKPKVAAPPKKNAPKPTAHWDALLGDLGLEVPHREPEPEPEPVVETPEVIEAAPAAVFAEKSPLDEIFVPRERVEEDLLDLFESVSVERSDASYFEVTESETVEDSIEVTVEDLEEEAGTQPRRRRRRARGRRDSRPVDPVIEPVVEQPAVRSPELIIEAEPDEEIIEPLISEAELAVEESIEEPIELQPATEERPTGRKRSRRRRRSKSSGSGERREREEGRSPESSPAVHDESSQRAEDAVPADLEDEVEVEVSGWDSDDEEDRDDQSSNGTKSKSKKITGWIEAVSVMVDANIERHKKGEPDRNRGGRSRGRRGR